MQGRIVRVVESKGFGFIRPLSGPPDLFFHVSSLDPAMEWSERLREMPVEFDTRVGDKGEYAIGICPARA